MYSQRIDKVRMALMTYLNDIKVMYQPGVQMTMVDPISRVPGSDVGGSSCGIRGCGRWKEAMRMEGILSTVGRRVLQFLCGRLFTCFVFSCFSLMV
jgi:hypothetical protein